MDGFDRLAKQQLEIVVGTDEVVRINIDSICAMRVRIAPGAEIAIDQRDVSRVISYEGK